MVLSYENTIVAEHFVQDLMMQKNVNAGLMKGVKQQEIVLINN